MTRFALIALLSVCHTLPFLPEAAAQVPSSGRAIVVPVPYWGYTYNPYASALRGVADVTRANAQYLVTVQKAALLQEQVRVAKLATRTEALIQWAWEREFKAEIFEKQRQKIRALEVERSLKDTPNVEIFDASALNVLLRELSSQPLPDAGSTPLDPDTLAHIHVASPAGGNLGLLKNSRIHWPLMLRTSTFAAEREIVEQMLDQVRKYLGATGNNDVPAEDIFRLRKLLSNLKSRADQAARGSVWSPSDSIKVDRFLIELQHTVQLLEQPETAIYLRPLQGRTVSELVASMKSQGLTAFAPATAGNERHYIAFHRSLVEELNRVRPPGRSLSQP